MGTHCTQRRPALSLKCVGDDPLVAHELSDPADSRIEKTIHMGGARGTHTQDFQCVTVVQSPSDGPTGDRDAEQSASCDGDTGQ
jgi:hypothetical protein